MPLINALFLVLHVVQVGAPAHTLSDGAAAERAGFLLRYVYVSAKASCMGAACYLSSVCPGVVFRW